MNLSTVLSLNLEDFFAYVKTIPYGYQDQTGGIHVLVEEGCFDPEAYPYAYSTPEEVVTNNCGWCWDVCQLTQAYCRANRYPCKTCYMEYYDPEKQQHQTHTQCFAQIDGRWIACPDNSDPEFYDFQPTSSLDELLAEDAQYFFAFCASLFGPLDPAHQLVKAYNLSFPHGMTDDDLMQAIRDF